MTAVLFRLLLNPIPVLGTAFVLALLDVGRLRRRNELQRLALGGFVVVTLLAIPAYLTDEPTEHAPPAIPDISHSLVGAREDAAEFAFGGILILGLAAVVVVLVGWIANLGGAIRHPEIHPGPTGASSPALSSDESKTLRETALRGRGWVFELETDPQSA